MKNDKDIKMVHINVSAQQKEHKKTSPPFDEKLIYKKIFKAISCALFGLILVFLLVCSVFDKDDDVSELEKRSLAQKPHLSLSSIADGSFMSDFDNYYNDQFPFRISFLKFGQKISSILTQHSSGEDGDVIINIKKNDDDFGGEGVDIGLDETTEKNDEKENTTEMTTKDVRDKEDDETENGNVIVSKNRAMEIYTYNKPVVEKYITLLNSISASIPDNVRMYSLIAPTSIEFYGSSKYASGTRSQKDAIKDVYSKLSKDITTVDAYTKIAPHNDEYIYFRTDHHWTARGAYYAYTAFCEAAGISATPLEEYKTHTINGFVGSLYNITNYEPLKDDPDDVECFEPVGDVTNMVYSSADLTNGIKTYVVAKNVVDSNKYLAFISGDQPICDITTTAGNGKKIMVIKESYGNAFVPFLCANYEEIFVVDPRKVTFSLPTFLKDNEIDELLMINYSFCMTNSTFRNALSDMIY